MPGSAEDLRQRMARLGIDEADLEEHFIRGSGKGGQKRNKTSACVRLVHRPSGIEVRCDRERSQMMNRRAARRMLCERIESRRAGARRAARQQAEKTRRRNRKRPEKVKRKMISDRYHKSRKKQLRRSPGRDD